MCLSRGDLQGSLGPALSTGVYQIEFNISTHEAGKRNPSANPVRNTELDVFDSCRIRRRIESINSHGFLSNLIRIGVGSTSGCCERLYLHHARVTIQPARGRGAERSAIAAVEQLQWGR